MCSDSPARTSSGSPRKASSSRPHPHVTIQLSHDAAPVLATADADAQLDIAFIDGPTDVACTAAGVARRTACEAQNMQYLAELVQHGLGMSILPPASVRAVTAHVATIPLTPPLRRDICAVTAATRPPTGPAQALLDILQADISR